MTMIKNIITVSLLILGIIISVGIGSFTVFSEKCEEVQGDVLRLHIPANSDSEDDQKIKLEVRDMVLSEFSGELAECKSVSEAEEKIILLLPEIEERCNEFLRERGFEYSARAELSDSRFPTREYDRVILPAGEYRALKITLGKGEGHNWWCVIFPQLCLPAVSEPEKSDVLAADFQKPQGFTIKFAVYEWLRNWF